MTLYKTFIYCLSDPITLIPKYIGKSNNPTKRLISGHLAEKGNNKKHTWIKSLKAKNQLPILEILDEVSEKEWQFWEMHYISLYKSWGFELKNGDNGGLGTGRLTSESIAKRTASLKQTRGENYKPWNYGRARTDKEKQKLYEINPNKKEVEQIDIVTGKIIACYPSLSKAASTIGIKNYSQISNSIRKNSLCKGYKWKFKK